MELGVLRLGAIEGDLTSYALPTEFGIEIINIYQGNLCSLPLKGF